MTSAQQRSALEVILYGQEWRQWWVEGCTKRQGVCWCAVEAFSSWGAQWWTGGHGRQPCAYRSLWARQQENGERRRAYVMCDELEKIHLHWQIINRLEGTSVTVSSIHDIMSIQGTCRNASKLEKDTIEIMWLDDQENNILFIALMNHFPKVLSCPHVPFFPAQNVWQWAECLHLQCITLYRIELLPSQVARKASEIGSNIVSDL